LHKTFIFGNDCISNEFPGEDKDLGVGFLFRVLRNAIRMYSRTCRIAGSKTLCMSVSRLFDLIPHCLEKFPKADALAGKENGKWTKYSTTDFAEYANNFSYGLLAMGLQRGDKIGIISNNRPEWNMADMGILQAGCVDVPIYPTISDSDLKFIIQDAQLSYVIVSNKILYDKVKACAEGHAHFKGIYSFNPIEGIPHWSEILSLGKKQKDQARLTALMATIQETDLATMLYTSGTTGTPKGVMLSHRNLFSNVYASRKLAPVNEQCKALSFLPLNHIYERMLTYLYMYLGVSIYYAESIDTISENLKEIHPEVFSSVPRLLEKVYDKILATGEKLTGIKKALFFWSVSLGERYEMNGANGWWYELQLKIARKLVFSKWKEALGGNLRCTVSGGAALNPKLARIFWAAGVNVLEGYGLTETSPVISVNFLEPDSAHFGTVGRIIEGVTVKFAEDGEILAKGPNVMMGYYNRPDATAEAIDPEGYFHTGDIGTLIDGKFLKITDRKKEIFKTSGGKYIAPQMIENKLKESRFIEQSMVVGENQKYAAAFVVPSFKFLQEYCTLKGIPYTSNEEIIQNPVIKARIMKSVDEVNKTLAHYETIKKIELLPHEWTVERGELSPKLSLKRKVILEENKQLLTKIFND
jgi:long-chain acyl-CoA synthetase